MPVNSIEYPNFKVCVRCFTFNQAEFIIDAFNGITMQQTDFPYICCVVDDASTDGEQEVIREYLEQNFDLSENSCHFENETEYAKITYAQHRSNRNCFFAVLFLKENLYSKREANKKFKLISEWRKECEYESVCEGDDFWTDLNKLQKQVSFLDLNDDYVLCHTGFNFLYQDKCLIEEDKSIVLNNKLVSESLEPIEYAILDDNRYRIQTVTVMYRLSTYEEIFDDWMYCSRNLKMGDTQLWVLLSQKGKIHYDEGVSSVYRIIRNSACRQQNKKAAALFLLSCARMRMRVGRVIGIPIRYQRRFAYQFLIAIKRYCVANFVENN